MVNGKCWTIKFMYLNFPRIVRASVKLVRSMLLNFFSFHDKKKSYFYNSGGMNGHFLDFISTIMEIKIEISPCTTTYILKSTSGYIA